MSEGNRCHKAAASLPACIGRRAKGGVVLDILFIIMKNCLDGPLGGANCAARLGFTFLDVIAARWCIARAGNSHVLMLYASLPAANALRGL